MHLDNQAKEDCEEVLVFHLLGKISSITDCISKTDGLNFEATIDFLNAQFVALELNVFEV